MRMKSRHEWFGYLSAFAGVIIPCTIIPTVMIVLLDALMIDLDVRSMGPALIFLVLSSAVVFMCLTGLCRTLFMMFGVTYLSAEEMRAAFYLGMNEHTANPALGFLEAEKKGALIHFWSCVHFRLHFMPSHALFATIMASFYDCDPSFFRHRQLRY